MDELYYELIMRESNLRVFLAVLRRLYDSRKGHSKEFLEYLSVQYAYIITFNFNSNFLSIIFLLILLYL